MLPDETANKWAIELRDTDAHEVHYTIIDINKKQSFKQDLSVEDAWWTGITEFREDKLVIHRFQDSENPELKDFYMLDLQTEKLCWESEKENFVFLRIYNNEIYGYEKTAENRKIHKIISIADDSVRTVDAFEFERKIRQIAEEQERNKALIYPFYYPQEHAYFETVSAFLGEVMHIHAVKGCEYLEHQGAVIISYYIYENKSLTNYLLVINQAQEVLLHDKIDSQLDGIGVDTFFAVNNRLIFIKEKHHLESYALDNVR